MISRFVLDIESTSTVDLRKAGAAAYWEHPDTRIIVLAYLADDNDVQRWRPGDPVPYFVPDAASGSVRVVAHNWLFEYNAWINKLGPLYHWPVPPMRAWHCTMARALYWGLPAGLIDVAEALRLPYQIDKAKHARIVRMARPRSVNPLTWWHETDTVRLGELMEDCDQDVRAEAALDTMLPALPQREREIFLLDGQINMRGIGVDLPMIERMQAITDAEQFRLNTVLAEVTAGRVTSTNQVKAIGEELARLGYPVPSLAKAEVADALAKLEPPLNHRQVDYLNARLILRTRLEAAKASTGKLRSMVRGASRDGRCRGLFQYGGAGRTLRWAGRRVQAQNFPRGTVKGVSSIFKMLEADPALRASDLEPLLPGSVMDALSSMLRGCFIPRAGCRYVSADLAQIEARVVAWLAGQHDILAVFASGKDVYSYTAAQIGSDSRQLGKVLVLACGFGMGPAKFQMTAATYGLHMDAHAAEVAVMAWRRNNYHIVSLWWDVDRTAKAVAVSPHGTEVTLGWLKFRKTRKAVRIVLPSGRELTYQNIALETDEFGQESLSYWGVHPKTKQWAQIRTYGGRLVENITQATARDVMAEAMLQLDRAERAVAGSRDAVIAAGIVATVHDELLIEVPAADADRVLADALAAMRTTPTWAPGLPVGAEGWTCPRYRK